MIPLRRIVFFTVVLLIAAGPMAHAHDVQIPVIVDTDAAFDDIRALSLLMNAGDVDIRLIVTSDGVLDPESGRQNMRRLLAYYNHGDVPVKAGEVLRENAPAFRPVNERMKWPTPADTSENGLLSPGSAASAIADAVKNAGSQVLYICLGPMTNLANAIKTDPEVKNRIYRILYLGEVPESDNPGFNTNRDHKSAAAVFDSGLSIYSFGLNPQQYLPFNMPMYHSCCKTDSAAGRLICALHSDAKVQERIQTEHMGIWDEMTVIGLFMPEAFTFIPDKAYSNHMRLAKFDADTVKNTYMKLLGNPMDFHLDARNSVVLAAFPMDFALFRKDVAPHVEEIIRLHGEEEWKACLLTHELHRHLGIYSLVGAKMGIRARELLDAPFDSLEVVSSAGLKPPLSCMNDGLQVATGASLGRGTIRVIEGNPNPTVAFIYGDSRRVLVLKQSYIDRIKSDIQAALEKFGGLGPSYFAHIRKLSIQYWKIFDRREMFEDITTD